MARPIKKGLDFFPLDVSLDDNLELVEAECGLEGFAIVIKLWQKIYANGYYIEWEEENALLFSRRINSDLTTVNSVINACFKRNLFNKLLYEQHKILTSKGIQSRYDKICRDAKRKDFEINLEFNLINPEFIPEKQEFTPEESTQSKVNKSKEEKSKRFIPPTLEEVSQYCRERNNYVDAQKFIDFYESKGWYVGKNKMKSWKASVRTWEAKNKNNSRKVADF